MQKQTANQTWNKFIIANLIVSYPQRKILKIKKKTHKISSKFEISSSILFYDHIQFSKLVIAYYYIWCKINSHHIFSKLHNAFSETAASSANIFLRGSTITKDQFLPSKAYYVHRKTICSYWVIALLLRNKSHNYARKSRTFSRA